MKARWNIVTLVCAALLVGTVFGPVVVQAATAGLVRIEGGGSTHVATVNSAGQLSVTEGTAHTRAGQLQVATAAPSQTVTKYVYPSCAAGGSYKPPKGKALIITGLTFFNSPTSPASPSATDLAAGPAATPCTAATSKAIAATDVIGYTTVPETFDPGIAVPAGWAIGGQVVNNAGAFFLYGYLVPAADVPASALSG